MAFLGVFRGYFQGHGTMVPTATSQIAEQVFFNAVVSVAAGYMLFKAGTERDLAEGTEDIPFGRPTAPAVVRLVL